MKTSELFKEKKVLSYEVFPPKRTSNVGGIYSTLEHLEELNPDFISVTYGAGGSENSRKTFEITHSIQNDYRVPGVAHLACVGLTKEQLLEKIEDLKALGIENVLALRGDMPKDGSGTIGDFAHASDLISFLREHSDFDILAACYPEVHPAATSREDDLLHLKEKVEAGANHLVSQLFFDNEDFYRFLDDCRRLKIDVPIEAGIMPVTNRKQIERMTTMCGASIPKKLQKILERFGDNEMAMRDAGIAYAIDQIVDLMANDVDGVHLYTMNKPFIAHRIHTAVHNLF